MKQKQGITTFPDSNSTYEYFFMDYNEHGNIAFQSSHSQQQIFKPSDKHTQRKSAQCHDMTRIS